MLLGCGQQQCWTCWTLLHGSATGSAAQDCHAALPHTPSAARPALHFCPQWERSKWVGVSMVGKTLAIMGFGKVGSEVARRAKGELN